MGRNDDWPQPPFFACSITAATSALLVMLRASVNSVELRGPSGTFASCARSFRDHKASLAPFYWILP